jgi:hypothetical protein
MPFPIANGVPALSPSGMGPKSLEMEQRCTSWAQRLSKLFKA